jgi:dimethylglycine dehydrogenase
VHSEFTILRESENSFYLVSAGALQRLDHDYIRRFMPTDDSVHYTHLTDAMGVLVIAGPRSRELLNKVSSADFSNESFRWLTAQNIEIDGCQLNAMRVNYVGELGWELHHPIEHQNQIFDALFAVGADLGLKPFGIRAMDTMRIEKSYRMVGTELSIEYSAFESAMDRFICLDKGDFLGRDKLIEWQERGIENQLVTLEIDGIKDADVLGNNALTLNGELVGRATGGGFGFRVNRSLALAMVKPNYATLGSEFSIDILGESFQARVIADSPFDGKNERLRDVNGANA